MKHCGGLRILTSLPNAAPMTFHLHIGAHKTATTHLQATLIKHRDALADAGVQFERPDDIRSVIGPGRRAAAQMGPIPSFRRAGASRRLARLDQGRDRLVLSDENSLGLCPELFQRELLYPTAYRRLTVWRRLAAQRETVVYLCVRNYAAFFSSAYVQTIRKKSIIAPDADSLVAMTRMPRRWGDVIHDVRRALPDARLKVWAFEDHFDLLPSLLQEQTGLDLTPVRRRPMATPSVEAVAAFRIVSRRRRRPLDQLAKEHPITDENPKFSLWTEAQSAALTEMYEEDVAGLRRDLGEEFLRP